MSSERPYRPEQPLETDFERLLPAQDDVIWAPTPPPPRKFQHNYRLHLILFGLTFVTTNWVWTLGWVVSSIGSVLFWQLVRDTFWSGLWYSVPLLLILSAHEFGHYFACRYYNVDASLPYYLPSPLPPAGTFGAVIRIREAFPSKKALFDIGIAGPIAGFVALLPFLAFGMKWSHLAPEPPHGVWNFAEPLLLKVAAWLRFGPIPDGQTIQLHPVGMGAWWGMFATFLNLLPFGQLDGGHIAYAAVGRQANRISVVTLACVLLLGFKGANWLVMAGLMITASYLFGFGHPRVVDEHVPLDPIRRALVIFAIAMLVLCFMPAPISTY